MEEEKKTVTLTLDSGENLVCKILTKYTACNQEYIALSPLVDGEENGEVYIYRFALTPEGNPDLTLIEDDEEYEIAADGFDEWQDTVEFNNMNAEHLEDDSFDME